ncbi:zinc-binding dehydrogenase [Arthrobacter sp. JCM 19049]|uniref:zinc-binding dehydrogenase n=1 Tax=Arthrobacter sp. JCM 19049 TaxID=1460643 RepID=UPI0006D246E0|nr:zinc-binding dehydrogenase [Arthrobacter sp. JCM 19049]
MVIHAAAGGLGQLLTQIAKLKGATVIGTTSSEEKAEIARANGADYVVDYGDLVERVHEITGGDGATVVYDGVGKTTFNNSMDALGVRGTLALIGNAGGPVEPVDVNRLNAGGSLFLTRPTVMHHIRTPEEIDGRIADVFRWIQDGSIHVTVGQRFERAR